MVAHTSEQARSDYIVVIEGAILLDTIMNRVSQSAGIAQKDTMGYASMEAALREVVQWI